MHIVFGLHLDGYQLQPGITSKSGIAFLGPQSLLNLLERLLGLAGHPSDTEYLRVEQFRQSIRKYLDAYPEAFFARSFLADQFATATQLLAMRDELLLGGWDFKPAESAPLRLRHLAGLEERFARTESNPWPGFADRICTVLEELSESTLSIQTLTCKEPDHLLPPHWTKLFRKLADQGCRVEFMPQPSPAPGKSDLISLQNILTQGPAAEKIPLQADGSLLILQADTPHEAATFLAQLIRKNPSFRPLCLVGDRIRTLDDALIHERQPSLGLPSASLARPTLQILKLAPAFLWEPIDPYKVLEFVSLGIKPIDEELARVIAHQIAQTPGLNSDSWEFAIRRFFDRLAQHKNGQRKLESIRRQYHFWFSRNRYQLHEDAPKDEVIEIFDYLQHWAFQLFEEGHAEHRSLLVLSEQARRIRDILRAAPEETLSPLQVERIVRTIYEPSPIVFQAEEVDHLPVASHPGAILAPTEELLWWNFIQAEPVHFFSDWYQEELSYLKQQPVDLIEPALQNAQLLWYRKHPLLMARKRAVLVLPKTVLGDSVAPHPLLGDMMAAFDHVEKISCPIWEAENHPLLDQFFALPQKVSLTQRELGSPKPFIEIKQPERLTARERESYSSLSNLFYYPYQWVFRYKLRLRKSSILSVVDDYTLMGNLAHRLFELLLQEDIRAMDKIQIESWIDRQIHGLLAREGSVLLMYGREPEKVNFINRLKYAAWSLVNLLNENDWDIAGLEESLEGHFLDIPIGGIADLVLKRSGEQAIVDLKWSGTARRSRMIKNEEDLQLVLYSYLLGEQISWPHTAYFIIKDGKMIARNKEAFKHINPVSPEANAAEICRQILERMETTYQWRRQQFEEGLIEIRCEQTVEDLEVHYAQTDYGVALMDLLEMPSESARYDDYQTLINLLE